MGTGAKVKLIAFTGLPRSGKDTAAAYLVREYGYERQAFADPLKKAAAILLGRPAWQMFGEQNFDRDAILPEWGFTTRDFLQRFGTECIRNVIAQDFWVKRMRMALERSYVLGTDRIAITDCRFENEAAMVRSLGGVVVEIHRPGIKGSGHASDNGVSPDFFIPNAGSLEDLYNWLDGVVSSYHAKATG